MDALASFLDGPRAQGAFLLRSMLEPPWCLRIQDEAPLTVLAMVRGEAWITFDSAQPRPLVEGDVAVVRGPEPYTVADQPGRPPQVIIHPGQRCTTPDGQSVYEAMDLGVRTWGNSATGSVVMVTGTYQSAGEVSRRLLDALPQLVVVDGDGRGDGGDGGDGGGGSPVVPLLAAEVARDDPGQSAVLDRLLDVLLVAALRIWFDRDEATVPPWYRAHGDPVVGRVLRLMHNDPAHPWTVGELASTVGVSRAGLARRFHEQVGEPPMAFLTGWRMALAADLLADPSASVGAVARRVGYGSPFTFSTAFKRTYGASPTDYRAAVLARATAAAPPGPPTGSAVASG